jgi:pyroglutamyl-peptidase
LEKPDKNAKKVPMNLLIIGGIVLSFAQAKPLIILSYFDAFGGAKFNNSERIAKILEGRLNSEESEIELRTCPLNTVYDKAFFQLEACIKSQKEVPALVISFGESTCEVKLETIMRNRDESFGPDNEGNERKESPIKSGAPDFIGLRYPLPQMYCALSEQQRKKVDVSNFAGSFVCNNTGYQMSHYYPELQYGFIHIPANYCSRLDQITEDSIMILEKMILKASETLKTENSDVNLPHYTNDVRLPTTKEELKSLRAVYETNECLSDFFQSFKAPDEKRSVFFGVMN